MLKTLEKIRTWRIDKTLKRQTNVGPRAVNINVNNRQEVLFASLLEKYLSEKGDVSPKPYSLEYTNDKVSAIRAGFVTGEIISRNCRTRIYDSYPNVAKVDDLNVSFPPVVAQLWHISHMLSHRPNILATQDSLEEQLRTLDHTYRYSEQEGNPSQYTIPTYFQRIRIGCIFDALKNDEHFRRDIQKMLDNSPIDGESELGGLVFYDQYDKMMKITKLKNWGADIKSFGFSTEDLDKYPFIASIHTHAMFEDCTNFAGPSIGRKSDMGMSYNLSREGGEMHNLVVSRLPGNKVNIKYFGHFFHHPGMTLPGFPDFEDNECIMSLGDHLIKSI